MGSPSNSRNQRVSADLVNAVPFGQILNRSIKRIWPLLPLHYSLSVAGLLMIHTPVAGRGSVSKVCSQQIGREIFQQAIRCRVRQLHAERPRRELEY